MSGVNKQQPQASQNGETTKAENIDDDPLNDTEESKIKGEAKIVTEHKGNTITV